MAAKYGAPVYLNERHKQYLKFSSIKVLFSIQVLAENFKIRFKSPDFIFCLKRVANIYFCITKPRLLHNNKPNVQQYPMTYSPPFNTTLYDVAKFNGFMQKKDSEQFKTKLLFLILSNRHSTEKAIFGMEFSQDERAISCTSLLSETSTKTE
jgi:hypothetical protein